MKQISIETKRNNGISWVAVTSILVAMCVDQFIVDLPFLNIVFPLLIIAALSFSSVQNFALIVVYSLLFELSCIAWMPRELVNVQFWLIEVTIGYAMPFIVTKIASKKNKNLSVLSISALAALSELLYFWVSVIATVCIWHIDFATYFLSDLYYELVGCVATFACALPVAFGYKLLKKEIKMPLKKHCLE